MPCSSCKGSELTLRDCTITIVGPLPHPFAVVQMGEPGDHPSAAPARVRIERTLIRGAFNEAIRMSDGRRPHHRPLGHLCRLGAGESRSREGRARMRKVAIFRSTIAASGPILEIAGAVGIAGAKPSHIEACQSTFAHIGGRSPARHDRASRGPGGAGRKGPLVDWSGDDNSFAGLKEWTTSSPPGLLAGLRAMAPSADKNSTDDAPPLPATIGDPWSADARKFTPRATAAPSPRLREKSLESFGRSQRTKLPGAAVTATLSFDAGDPADSHDLGKFVAESLKIPTNKVLVIVRGKGLHTMTPVKMPEGVSLELVFEAIKPGELPLSMVAAEGSNADALFSVRNADLAISGARLLQDGRSPALKSLVSVDHGVLSLERCILTAPKEAEIGNGSLVRFRTDGTRPLIGSNASYATCRLTDCVVISGANALWAEIGRGAVELSNCAIAAGGTAIALRPEDVRRDRFEADLRLDRCTIASEQALVSVGAWPGLAPGPDRPWVVSSQASVFLDTYDRGGSPSPSVLLRSDPAGLSQGVLIWESSGDVFDVAHFTAGGDAPPPSVSRPDVQRQWVDLWGPTHVKDASGPRPGGPGPAARLLRSRLKLGNVEPGDLALDPDYPPGRKALQVGADLGKMGLSR